MVWIDVASAFLVTVDVCASAVVGAVLGTALVVSIVMRVVGTVTVACEVVVCVVVVDAVGAVTRRADVVAVTGIDVSSATVETAAVLVLRAASTQPPTRVYSVKAWLAGLLSNLGFSRWHCLCNPPVDFAEMSSSTNPPHAQCSRQACAHESAECSVVLSSTIRSIEGCLYFRLGCARPKASRGAVHNDVVDEGVSEVGAVAEPEVLPIDVVGSVEGVLNIVDSVVGLVVVDAVVAEVVVIVAAVVTVVVAVSVVVVLATVVGGVVSVVTVLVVDIVTVVDVVEAVLLVVVLAHTNLLPSCCATTQPIAALTTEHFDARCAICSLLVVPVACQANYDASHRGKSTKPVL